MTNLMSERARRMRREKEPAERRLWSLLRDWHGFHFRQQAPIGPYIADFCDHTAKPIIEVGGSHHDEPKHRASDQRRTRWLTSQGCRVLRFWNHEVETDPGGVEIEIRVALGMLAENGEEPHPTAFVSSPMERLRQKASQLARMRRPRKTRSTRLAGQRAIPSVPSPLVGEEQGGGDGGTSKVGNPPTPSPPQRGGESRRRVRRGSAPTQGGQTDA